MPRVTGLVRTPGRKELFYIASDGTRYLVSASAMPSFDVSQAQTLSSLASYPLAPVALNAGNVGRITGPSVPMQIEPGAYLELQNTILELQRQESVARDAREKERIAIERKRLEQAAREMELRLSTTPIDYVAYEQYRREKEKAGETLYTGPPASDVDIQAMIAAMVGEGGGALGTGEFGVEVPMTQAISRAEALTYSPAEMDILGSFLKAGFDVNGEQVSYDPVDYWREVEEGFIPAIQTPARTQYAF